MKECRICSGNDFKDYPRDMLLLLGVSHFQPPCLTFSELNFLSYYFEAIRTNYLQYACLLFSTRFWGGTTVQLLCSDHEVEVCIFFKSQLDGIWEPQVHSSSVHNFSIRGNERTNVGSAAKSEWASLFSMCGCAHPLLRGYYTYYGTLCVLSNRTCCKRRRVVGARARLVLCLFVTCYTFRMRAKLGTCVSGTRAKMAQIRMDKAIAPPTRDGKLELVCRCAVDAGFYITFKEVYASWSRLQQNFSWLCYFMV